MPAIISEAWTGNRGVSAGILGGGYTAVPYFVHDDVSNTNSRIPKQDFPPDSSYGMVPSPRHVHLSTLSSTNYTDKNVDIIIQHRDAGTASPTVQEVPPPYIDQPVASTSSRSDITNATGTASSKQR